MKTYDYLENVKEDVRNYIEENKIVVTSRRKSLPQLRFVNRGFKRVWLLFVILRKRCRDLRRYNTLLSSWAG